MNSRDSDLFATVSTNLEAIGARSVAAFLAGGPKVVEEMRIWSQVSQAPTTSSSEPTFNTLRRLDSHPHEKTTLPSLANTRKAQLEHLCRSTNGSGESVLVFEYFNGAFTDPDGDDKGKGNKKASGFHCTLTVKRPNGASHSYTSLGREENAAQGYTTKDEAQACAIRVAFEKGVASFIAREELISNRAGNGKLVLERLHQPPGLAEQSQTGGQDEVSSDVQQIEDCCTLEGGPLIHPEWFSYNDEGRLSEHKFILYGAALRVKITPHILRVYSTGTTYSDPAAAKIGCAGIAVQEGVLAYIAKESSHLNRSASGSPSLGVESAPFPQATTLQAFYESLPQPLPEDVIVSRGSGASVSNWFNKHVLSARTTGLDPQFIWIQTKNLGLHGCLLRLDMAGHDSKSYLVAPSFSKRAEAKTAVCLQAISEGVGGYVRSLVHGLNPRVTPDMREMAKALSTIIYRECSLKRGPAAALIPNPNFDFTTDRLRFGCTLEIMFQENGEEKVHKFSVATEHRTKADAKVAVIISAGKDGIVELLKFRGDDPPPGYVPWVDQYTADRETETRKRNKKKQRSAGLQVTNDAFAMDTSATSLVDDGNHSSSDDNQTNKRPRVSTFDRLSSFPEIDKAAGSALVRARKDVKQVKSRRMSRSSDVRMSSDSLALYADQSHSLPTSYFHHQYQIPGGARHTPHNATHRLTGPAQTSPSELQRQGLDAAQEGAMDVDDGGEIDSSSSSDHELEPGELKEPTRRATRQLIGTL